MLWRSGRESDNVEDRRDSYDDGGGSSGGMGGGLKLGFLGTVAVLVIGWYMGASPMQLLGMVGGADAILGGISGGSSSSSSAPAPTAHNGVPADDGGKFASVVLATTEDAWTPIFQQMGMRYTPPKLVLFQDQTRSGCGYSSAATGPFYCPADQKVYLDLGFYRELKQLGGGDADFARAYVLGHEVGHHVQNLLGITEKIEQLQSQVSQRDGNALSVALELQADCYAGIWAHYTQQNLKMLEAGDLESAINAAGSIGDDRLQRMSGQYVNPDSFTHGSSRQRMEWLQRGMQSGDLRNCNTFAGLKM